MLFYIHGFISSCRAGLTDGFTSGATFKEGCNEEPPSCRLPYSFQVPNESVTFVCCAGLAVSAGPWPAPPLVLGALLPSWRRPALRLLWLQVLRLTACLYFFYFSQSLGLASELGSSWHWTGYGESSTTTTSTASTTATTNVIQNPRLVQDIATQFVQPGRQVIQIA